MRLAIVKVGPNGFMKGFMQKSGIHNIIFGLILAMAPITLLAGPPSTPTIPKSSSEKVTSNDVPTTVKDITNPNPQTQGFWADQWDKANIAFGQSLVNTNTTIMGSVGLGLSIDYNYLVQPAYIQNKQQRIDRYSAQLNLSKAFPALAGISVGGTFSTQVSFSRIMDAKSDAVFIRPYFLNKIPWDTNRALNDINPGDVVRIELSTGLSLGDGMYRGVDGYGGNFYASISRSANLLVDVYKMDKNIVRVRLMAIRRTGDMTAGLTLEPLNPMMLAKNVLERPLTNRFVLHPLNFSFGGNSKAQFPVETFMLDYVFNLSTPEASTAFDSLMNNIGKINIREYLNFQLSSSSVGERMLTLASDVETLVQKYIELPPENRPIDRVFKGKSSTQYGNRHLGSQLKLGLNVWNKQLDSSHGTTSIRGYNDLDQQSSMLYLSNYDIDNFEFGWDFWQTLKFKQSEILTMPSANEKDIHAISDMVFTRNLSDKTLSDKDVEAAKAYIGLTIPNLVEEIDWKPYLNGKTKRNGYIQIKTVFHESTLNTIRTTEKSIYDRLHVMVDAYPEYILTTYSVDTEDTELQINGRLEYDIRDVAKRLAIIFDPEKNLDEKLEAFSLVRRYPLYQELGAALIASYLPQDQLNDLVYMDIQAGAAGLPFISKTVGKYSLTKSYSSLQFMLGLINNRSFDLRIQLDAAESAKKVIQQP